MQDRFDALMHGSLSSITWKKVLRMNPKDANDFEATGVVKTQIDRITANLPEFHAIWLAPFEISLSLYFFFSFEGSTCLFMFPSLIGMQPPSPSRLPR